MLNTGIYQKVQFRDILLNFFLQDVRLLKGNRERQNKLASLGNRYIQSPKRLLVYPIAKEQFRSTSLTTEMLEKKGNVSVS